MRNISIGQVIILIILCFLLFGDFRTIKKKAKLSVKQISNYFANDRNRKKGT